MTPYLRTDGPLHGRVPRTDKAPTTRVATPRISVQDPDPDWRNRAACLGHDPEDWFPVSELETGAAQAHVERVKAICHGCPVADDCLAWAMVTGQLFGIWGGLTAKERAGVKRSQTRKPRSAA